MGMAQRDEPIVPFLGKDQPIVLLRKSSIINYPKMGGPTPIFPKMGGLTPIFPGRDKKDLKGKEKEKRKRGQKEKKKEGKKKNEKKKKKKRKKDD
jgi:hypothetical protein